METEFTCVPNSTRATSSFDSANIYKKTTVHNHTILFEIIIYGNHILLSPVNKPYRNLPIKGASPNKGAPCSLEGPSLFTSNQN